MDFSIGLSGIRTSQAALDIISGNLANASTPGYHRRNVVLDSLAPNQLGNQQVGSGVSIQYIERIRNQVTESSLTNSISDKSNVEQRLLIERQVEVLFQPGEGSIHERLDQFFGELTKLTSTPGEPTQRTAVVQQAENLTEAFHQISSALFELKSAVRYQVEQEVDSVNTQLTTLSELTASIRVIRETGAPNHELDQRDQLINEIAKVIDVSRHEHFEGGLNIAFGRTSIQQGIQAIELRTFQTEAGQLEIATGEREQPLSIESGRLPALLDLHNSVIPEFEARLNELAKSVMGQFDKIHAVGVGIDGSFPILTGNRAVADPGVPLDEAGAVFPITAGELSFSIIDIDGNRRTESISIDPKTQSLSDVATAISGIDNLQATVNSQTNKLQILASPGHKFDFTGSPETRPSTVAFTGSSVPTISGTYTGDINQTLSFAIEGTGDVGISTDLVVNVFDENGSLLSKTNIGQGYEAGTELEIYEGIQVAFSAGTANDADSFDSQLVSDSDTTGILVSLGLNSFFVGENADSIAVDSKILKDPRRFASTKTGDTADTLNLFSMIDLQSKRGMSGERLSFSEYVNEISTDIGSTVRSNTQLSVSITSLNIRYQQEVDSYSGVDLNEELIHLQQFQKSYEAAVKVLQATEQMLDELFTLLR